MISSELTLKDIHKSELSLGEGLIISNGIPAWVDINSNELQLYKNSCINTYSLPSKASVIYSIEYDDVFIGTERGVEIFNTNTKFSSLIFSIENHDFSEFRSNDGCMFANGFLLSFMHRSQPESNKGLIYYCDPNTKTNYVIDDEIHIPNSFICLDKESVLISDSLTGDIFLFKFNKKTNTFKKLLWSRMGKSLSPDGGCKIANQIFICMWDSAAIAVFNLSGKLLRYICVDVLRPTNCKYDENKSEFWVTTAREGLTKKQMKDYNNSGNIFVYKY